MNPGMITAALMASNAMRTSIDRTSNDNNSCKENNQSESVDRLLLGYEGEIIRISKKETIKSALFCFTQRYCGILHDIRSKKWVLKSEENEEEYVSLSFEDGIQKAIELYHAKGIQLIPEKVDYDHVNIYRILLVVDKEEGQHARKH